jgi:rRNA-processing protein CGR1
LRVLALTRPIGKQWHGEKKAFRPTSGLTSYEKRAKDRVAQAAMKAKEKELKEEKEADRQVHTAPGTDRTH